MGGRLEGRTAIVTGAGRGIGRAIAETFAREGAAVLVVNRSKQRGQATTRAIEKAGGRAVFLQADVSKAADMERMARTARDRLKRIDILAHNAGIFPSSMLKDMKEKEWDDVLDTNLKSAFLATRACLPFMRRRRYGRIVLTSSITGPRVAMPGWTHYAASKAGMNGFMKAAALEFAKFGITINAVEPGNIQVRDPKSKDGRQHARAQLPSIPMGHLGEPQDIANAALFLASDEASYVTGQSIVVDGGQILPEADSGNPLTAPPKIAVVGAGIVGAAIACQLARRGAAVTLVDRGPPGGGVTARAFAWINVSHGMPEPYFALRHLAIQEWRRLADELGGTIRIDWAGALTWSANPGAARQLVEGHAARGQDIRLVGRDEIARLEPNLAEPPDVAAFAAAEGALDAVTATRAIAAAATDAGAALLTDDAVAVEAEAGSVTGVRTGNGTIAAEVVVLANGTGAPALAGSLNVALPVEESPAVLVSMRAPGPLVGRILSGPAMEVRQAGRTRLLAAEDFPEGAEVQRIGEETVAAIRRELRGAETVTLESAEVGMRPMPADGLPIVGPCPGVDGLYAAVMHAGITLAPIVARHAATEILDGIAVQPLDSCRPDRFGHG